MTGHDRPNPEHGRRTANPGDAGGRRSGTMAEPPGRRPDNAPTPRTAAVTANSAPPPDPTRSATRICHRANQAARCPIGTPHRPPDRSAARPSTAAPLGQSTTIAHTGEFAVIDVVTSGMSQPPTTVIGPGDDAALVATPDGRVVASVDVLVDGVHFRTDWATGEQIGQRAALAAMADIAAMGAAPTALLVGLSAPPSTPTDLIAAIGRGLNEEAVKAGAGVVGGDLTRSEVLTIAVTVLGDLRGGEPVRRSGARAGDVVAVTGRLGWAAAGLAVLSRGFRSPAAAVGAYRVPDPPLQAGIVAAESGATSMIDVSDGLLADLGHIAGASGVTINVVTARLPVNPRLVEVASALGRNHLEWALTGGDDHALAATFPHGAVLPPGWTNIGTVSEGAPEGSTSGGAVTVDGAPWEQAGGWDHFG
jgi:thiamine-monophosphate kinase